MKRRFSGSRTRSLKGPEMASVAPPSCHPESLVAPFMEVFGHQESAFIQRVELLGSPGRSSEAEHQLPKLALSVNSAGSFSQSLQNRFHGSRHLGARKQRSVCQVDPG